MFKLKLSHLGATIALLSAAFTVATPKAAQAFSFSVEAPGVINTSRANATQFNFNAFSNSDVPASPTPLPIIPTNNGGVKISNPDPLAVYRQNVLNPEIFTGGARHLVVGSGPELS
jgi:hypothetical protein